jgi:hypothetical protein
MPDETGGQPQAEDEFDRALRRIIEGTAGEARFHELSASEREKAGARAVKQADKRAGAREDRRARTRRRAIRAASSLAVILVLAGGGVLASHRFAGKTTPAVTDSAISTATVTSSGSGAVPPASVVSSAGISSFAPFAGPPADPFSGTPADHWADGTAGITLPTAKQTGTFTSAQVAAAYATTRKILVAQNLDPTTLRGGKPTAFEKLLTLKQLNQFVRGLGKVGLAKDGTPLSTRAWVASFAPRSADLVGSVIKVHGTMSARATTNGGSKALDVDVNYRFVYVVERPGKPQDWTRIVGRVSGYIEFFNWQDPAGPLQPWIVSAYPFEAGAQCATTDGFIHPDYPSSPPASVRPRGPAIDPYSMAIPQHVGTCQPVTRT